MWDTEAAEIVGIQICCRGGSPISRGGVPIFGVGSEAVLPELRGREARGTGAPEGCVEEEGSWDERICEEVEGCGEVVIEPRPSGMVLCPDCLCKPAI